MALQPDGKVIITGGQFRESRQPSVFTRLNADGSLDESFTPVDGHADNFNFLVLQPDGKLLTRGTNGGVVRLNSDGSLDGGFVREGVVREFASAVSLQAGGKILVQGWIDLSDGSSRQIFQLNADGSLDSSFELDSRIGAGNEVRLLAVQPDGKLLVLAQMFNISGAVSHNVVRLNAEGTLDSSFDCKIDDPYLLSAIVQGDGRLIVAGEFKFITGFPRPGIARLNGDGKYIRMNLPAPLSSNEARLTISSQPGKTYALQVSSDLVEWIPLATNTASGYSLSFDDPSAMNLMRRFYQALLLSPR